VAFRSSSGPRGSGEAVGQELLEDVLCERAVVFVVAEGVVPMPDEPEQHPDSEQDDPGEAVIDDRYGDSEDRG
jgi:hypothetical protein